MLEEPVDVEDLICDLERNLAADEGKAAAEFQKQVREMNQKAALNLPLLRRAGYRQKN